MEKDNWESIDLKIIKFCAEEVERQRANPIAVWWMVSAWYDALMTYPERKLDTQFIIDLGKCVDPIANKKGFRTVMVYIGDHRPPKPEVVPLKIKEFVKNIPLFPPEENYRMFEEIHPFADGNGRTGKILYNWLKGTLDNPQMPPNFFGCANP